MLPKKYIIILFIISGLLGFSFSFYIHYGFKADKKENDVEVIRTFHYPALFAEQLKGDKNAGEKIFKEFCSACHAKYPTIDVQAPRIGDVNAWKKRKKLGIETLLMITIQGVGAMPARGGCFECSDEELREAIQYMIH
jgi:cytochrome c5